jgi:hypothetical protein
VGWARGVTGERAGSVALTGWVGWFGWLDCLAGLGDGPIDPSPRLMNSMCVCVY